jgi:hypothetical protein
LGKSVSLKVLKKYMIQLVRELYANTPYSYCRGMIFVHDPA